MIHIYTAPLQPATNFVDNCSDKPHRFRLGKRAKRTCYNCGVKRYAEHLQVQVFYDGIRFWCKKGKGCKKRQ